MREENKVLRKFVDQTMKEYCDLQMRVALIQQANKATVRGILLIRAIRFPNSYKVLLS